VDKKNTIIGAALFLAAFGILIYSQKYAPKRPEPAEIQRGTEKQIAAGSATAAAQGIKVPANLGIKISNPAGAGSYPITSQTFVILNKDLCKAGTPGGEEAAKGVVKFLKYGLGEGQKVLSQADYAGLPAAILTKSNEAVAALQCNGTAIGG